MCTCISVEIHGTDASILKMGVIELRTALFSDDEKYCVLKQISCPVQCYCLLFAIECRHISDCNIATLLQPIFLSIYISNSRFTLRSLQKNLENATFVRLPGNCLKYICRTLYFGTLLLLDLGYNCLKEIVQNCLVSLWLLKTIY